MRFAAGDLYTWMACERRYKGQLIDIYYNRKREMIGVFITRQKETWELPLRYPTLEMYKGENE